MGEDGRASALEGITLCGGRYRIVQRLGEGGYGVTWLAKLPDDQKVVIKVIAASCVDDKVRRGIAVLKSLRHPNIIRYIDHFEEMDRLCLVMEYATGNPSNLFDVISNGAMAEADVIPIFHQLVLVLHYFNQRSSSSVKVLHRDVKPGNVLLMEDGTVKLADFDQGRFLSEEEARRTKTLIGTVRYAAPEIFSGDVYDETCDIYSLGRTIMALLIGHEPPLKGRVAFEGRASPALCDLLRGMTAEDPSARWHIEDVLRSPVFRDFPPPGNIESDNMLSESEPAARLPLQDTVPAPSPPPSAPPAQAPEAPAPTVPAGQGEGQVARPVVSRPTRKEGARKRSSLPRMGKVSSEKVVLLGRHNAGKTALFRALRGEEFAVPALSPTVHGDMDIVNCFYSGLQVEARIWDTAGEERFDAITALYVKGASAALICFDTTDRHSFDCTERWADMARRNGGDLAIVLIVCKVDQESQITPDEAEQMRERIGAAAIHFTSALNGQGIDDLKATIAKVVLEERRKAENRKGQAELIPATPGRTCC